MFFFIYNLSVLETILNGSPGHDNRRLGMRLDQRSYWASR